MATDSIAFPKMFDVSRNRVAILEDDQSVVNRSRLLILTEPTEIYNEPNQGVGLKRHLWQYNNDNQKAIIRDRIIDQLRLHEPCCIPENTQISDGLLFTGTNDAQSPYQNYNHLKLTVAIQTTFGDTLSVSLNNDAEGGNG